MYWILYDSLIKVQSLTPLNEFHIEDYTKFNKKGGAVCKGSPFQGFPSTYLLSLYSSVWLRYASVIYYRHSFTCIFTYTHMTFSPDPIGICGDLSSHPHTHIYEHPRLSLVCPDACLTHTTCRVEYKYSSRVWSPPACRSSLLLVISTMQLTFLLLLLQSWSIANIFELQ